MRRSTNLPASLTLALSLLAGCPADAPELTVDDAGTVDPDIELLELDQGEFTVQPGEEVSYCMRLPMPEKFRGRDLALIGWEGDVPVPTHHYFMTYTPESTEGDEPVPCQGDTGVLPQSMSGEAFSTSGVLGTKILFAVGVGKSKVYTDRGYGAVIEADGTFVTNHHVLNLGDEPAEMHGRFKLAVKDASLVPHPVRNMVCSTVNVSVPAGKASSVTVTCLAPFDLDIVIMAGHAHARMTRFQARFYDGKETLPEVVYESHDWDSPEVTIFEKPMHLRKAQGITFTCDYMNNGDKNIAFGFEAEDEMCALFAGYAYPEDRTYEIPPPLFGTAFFSGQPVMVSDSTDQQFFF